MTLRDDSQIGLVCGRRNRVFLWHVRGKGPNDRKGRIALAGKLLPGQAMLHRHRAGLTAIRTYLRKAVKGPGAKYREIKPRYLIITQDNHVRLSVTNRPAKMYQSRD